MKKLLFFLLVVPGYLCGQMSPSGKYFLGIMPENSRSVHMPERFPSPGYNPDSSFRYDQKLRICVISSDSVYRLVFQRYNLTRDSLNKMITGPDARRYLDNDSARYKILSRYLVDSLPVIDFSKSELVLYSVCIQCLATCNHLGGDNEPCHRNVCLFTDKWYLREKEPWLTKWNDPPF